MQKKSLLYFNKIGIGAILLCSSLLQGAPFSIINNTVPTTVEVTRMDGTVFKTTLYTTPLRKQEKSISFRQLPEEIILRNPRQKARPAISYYNFSKITLPQPAAVEIVLDQRTPIFKPLYGITAVQLEQAQNLRTLFKHPTPSASPVPQKKLTAIPPLYTTKDQKLAAFEDFKKVIFKVWSKKMSKLIPWPEDEFQKYINSQKQQIKTAPPFSETEKKDLLKIFNTIVESANQERERLAFAKQTISETKHPIIDQPKPKKQVHWAEEVVQVQEIPTKKETAINNLKMELE